MTPKEVLEYAKANGAKMVDLKFIDLPGLWQHFSVPISEVSESSLEDGYGFDGSSIRGWQAINLSDMLVIPDPNTATMDPFTAVPTLTMICDVLDPITRERYSRDPRYIAQKAEAFLIQTALADTAYFGPELEFFVFDDIRYDFHENCGYYFIDSVEGRWNSGREEKPNLGYKPRFKEGYFPVSPTDTLQDLRTEMVLALERVGITVEAQHHEVATAGQCEIDMRFSPLTQMADKVMWYKYIVKNVARRHNKTATFMPKPIFGDNGTGMHVHQSLWKNGQPLFPGNDYAGLSKTALYYIGVILHHAAALCALVAPTTNSYKRLVPGFEAPVNLAYSARNRSAAVRIPMFSSSPKAKRLEFRPPDPLANPYLAFPAMLMAGLDGIERELNPGEPIDRNLYELPPEQLADIATVPTTLDEALDALESDHAFLTRGEVFTDDLIATYIEFRREQSDRVKIRPHPYEFPMYFDG